VVDPVPYTEAELEYIARAEARTAKARANAKARSRARRARMGIVSRNDNDRDERPDVAPAVRQRREEAKARRDIAKIKEKVLAWRRARDLARLRSSNSGGSPP
jgi:hypothetical protein